LPLVAKLKLQHLLQLLHLLLLLLLMHLLLLLLPLLQWMHQRKSLRNKLKLLQSSRSVRAAFFSLKTYDLILISSSFPDHQHGLASDLTT
jgi:hypothetical protein